jgi:hypothetical protein
MEDGSRHHPYDEVIYSLPVSVDEAEYILEYSYFIKAVATVIGSGVAIAVGYFVWRAFT